MNAWIGKYVIGLTGNIATGKSVVRRLLENLGAFGIDADSLANRLTSKGFPGYRPVVNAFGRQILDDNLEIDRALLGRLVFSDHQALKELETIVHPLVEEAIDRLMLRIQERVVVLEAIKLIESGFRERCDSLWVTDADENIQFSRLIENRRLTSSVAQQRIRAQPSQAIKTALADVVIKNNSTLEDLWLQVKTAWGQSIPHDIAPSEPGYIHNSIRLKRIPLSQSVQVEEWLKGYPLGNFNPSNTAVTSTFAEKGFLWIEHEARKSGVIIWKAENFIARVERIIINPINSSFTFIENVLDSVEHAAILNLCELMLIAVTNGNNLECELLKQKKYQSALPEVFFSRARKEAYESFSREYPEIWYKEIGIDPASSVGK